MTSDLKKLMAEATPGPWIPGHHTNPDHPCNCRSILAEGYFGSIATVNQSLTRDIEDGDCPPPEEAIANALLIVAAVNALPELIALREDMAKLNEPDGVLINMLRGTIPKVPATSLHKLYTEDELIDAAKAVFRARAALNQEPAVEDGHG